MFSTLAYQPSKSRTFSSTGASGKASQISRHLAAAGQSTVASQPSKTSSQSTGSPSPIRTQYGRSRSFLSPMIRSIMWKQGPAPSRSSAALSDMVPVRPKPTPITFTLDLLLGELDVRAGPYR